MKINKPVGSKERLFEMVEKVNKVQLNETFNQDGVLKLAFRELQNNQLNIEPKDTGDDNVVELLGTDKQGNTIGFIFSVDFITGDQDGVFDVTSVEMTNFSFDDVSGGEPIEMGENELRQFNTQFANELIEVVGDYVEAAQPKAVDELYEEAIKKIDSYPFGGTPRTMQTGKAYADEKPTNPKVRVSSPELDKFVVDEAIMVKPDTLNTGQRYFDKLDPKIKDNIIMAAKNFVNQQLAAQGMQSFDIPQDKYREEIKRVATAHLEQHLTQMNEEDDKKEKGDYPDQMGKKFKPKNQMPKKKRKPQSVVKLTEDFDDDDYLDLPDMDIPDDKRAMKAAKSDIARDNVVDKETDVDSDDTYDFVFNEEPELDFSNIGNGIGAGGVAEEVDVEKIEVDKEDVGDEIEGGKADDKLPAEFDPEQIAMGIKIEMEHTKDPMIAIEIAMDHLTEIPDYYTRLKQMEDDAKKNGAGSTDPMNPSGCLPDGMFMDKKDDESEDEELTDRLLGYEPKNVGDEVEDEEAEEEKIEPEAEENGEDTVEKEEDEEEEDELGESMITEEQVKMAKRTLSNSRVPTGMTKKEAVQILIKNNTKQIL